MAEVLPLLVLAPRRWHQRLRGGLAAAGQRAVCIDRPAGRGSAQTRALLTVLERWRRRVAAALLVLPRSRSLAQMPGPMCIGVPLGILPVDRTAQLVAWLETVRAVGRRGCRTVLAPWNGHHLPLAQRLCIILRRCAGGTHLVGADRVARARACEMLAKGPSSALYVGHGHAGGLVAFGGIGVAELCGPPLHRPIGTFVAFACSTLAAPRTGQPFGLAAVARGRAAGWFGSVDDVERHGNAALAISWARAVAAGARTIADCLARLDSALPAGDPRRVALSTYRCIGLPTARC